jgi:phosphorylcholine metabolism protein LicD
MNSLSKEYFFSILDYSKEKQKVILSIFDNFYNICATHHIPFFMCEGSLLGCFRHQGFVPWDDDIDIYMSYENFRILKQHIDYSQIELKENGLLYFYINKKNNSKIDIFLYPFKKNIYQVNNYIKSTFENYIVDVPYNSEAILNKLYPKWKNICYICNHKISIEKYKTWYAYLDRLKHLYENMSVNLAKEWVEEYDKKQNTLLELFKIR